MIELYINNDLFSIYVEKVEGNKTLVIDKTGVSYNNKNIDSFIFSTTPSLKNGENIIKTDLKENGDFRSQESIKMLKEADIVITNPPFSLFRDFFKILEDIIIVS